MLAISLATKNGRIAAAFVPKFTKIRKIRIMIMKLSLILERNPCVINGIDVSVSHAEAESQFHRFL